MSSSSQQQQRNFSILFTVVSLIFWIWAVINTVHNHSLDLGTISFLSVLITHSILLSSCCQSNNNCGALYAILGTHLFVTLNYLLGIYFALGIDMIQPPERRNGFAIYCGVAALLWFISAVVGYKIYNVKNNKDSNPPGSSTTINEYGAATTTTTTSGII